MSEDPRPTRTQVRLAAKHEELADQLRSEYKTVRRLVRPGYQMRPEEAANAVWLKCAKRIYAMGVDPVVWIRYLADEAPTGMIPLNWVASEAKFQKFKERQGEREEAHKAHIRYQMTIIEQHRQVRRIKDILLDDMLPLDAVVRFVVADRIRLDDVAAQFRDEAELRVKQCGVYRELFGDLFPEGFADD